MKKRFRSLSLPMRVLGAAFVFLFSVLFVLGVILAWIKTEKLEPVGIFLLPIGFLGGLFFLVLSLVELGMIFRDHTIRRNGAPEPPASLP